MVDACFELAIISMKFQINVCPLCNKSLRLKKVAGVNVYSCAAASIHGNSHYEVECDQNTIIQHIYVDDWCIDNVDSSIKSRVHKRVHNKWMLVAEPYLINADVEVNLRFQLSML